MLTQMKHWAAMVAACILGIYLSPAFAEDALAYGQFNASLGCDKTPEGLVVTLLDEVSRAKMRNNFGIDIEQGDPCLASLALFPPSFWSFAGYANFSPQGGATTTAPECLVWNFNNTVVKQQVTVPDLGTFVRRHEALVCGADGHGGLNTELVTGDYTPEEGESCGVTRAALTTDGTQTTGPIAAQFKYDGGGPKGGVLFVGHGPGVAEVLECNVNAAGDDLMVTYDETEHGVVTTTLGQPCMDVVDAHAATGTWFGIARPIPATDTSDPGCLIWDIDGGTIGDSTTGN